MADITRTVVLNDLTPKELAEIFAPMGSDEQAEFFDHLDVLSSQWGGLGWCGQCAYIADEIGDGGRKIIETLAGHVLSDQSA